MFMPDVKICVGDKWMDGHGVVRVMAIVEGYVLARRPRCMPFVLSQREFREKFVWIEQKSKR